MNEKVHLYHYTRANRESIEKNGLIARNKDEVRAKFINDFSSELSSNLLGYFNSIWKSETCDSNFVVDSNQSIWFVSKRPNENCGGIKPLVSMYGGEVISMCADSNDDAEVFLKSIGEPLEIVCSVPKNDPELVNLGNTEHYLKRDILPSEIVEINKLSYDPDKDEWKYQAL